LRKVFVLPESQFTLWDPGAVVLAQLTGLCERELFDVCVAQTPQKLEILIRAVRSIFNFLLLMN